MSALAEPKNGAARLSKGALAIGLLALAALIVSRLIAPDDIDAHDQAKQGLYVVDAFTQGRWLVPRELGEGYPTKPPLMTWLSLVVASMQGHVTVLGARAPSFLAAALTLVATLRFARRLGEVASATAALALVANTHVIACATLARTDMLLCAATTFAIGQLYESYEAFRGGVPHRGKFLMAAALAGVGTVAKSPVSLACPVAALVVFALLEKRARAFARSIVPALPAAFGIYLAIVGAWFVPAAITAGKPFVKTLADELLGHVAGTGDYAQESKFHPFHYPITHFLSKFLPWTIVPIAAFVGSPGDGVLGRADDRKHEARVFALSALAGSLAFFALMRIKRPDHVLPCYPWGACLVGAIVADWSSGRSRRAPGKLVGASFRLIGVAALAVSVVLPFAGRASRLIDRMPPTWLKRESREQVGAMLESLAGRPGLVLAVSLLAAPLGALAWAGGRSKRASFALAGTAGVVALVLVLYDHALSESVLTRKAGAVERFAARVRSLAGERRVAVWNAPPSVLFFLEQSHNFANGREGAVAEIARGSFGLVTGEPWLPEVVRERPDLVPVEASGYFSHNGVRGRLFLLVPAREAPPVEALVGRGMGREKAPLWWNSAESGAGGDEEEKTQR